MEKNLKDTGKSRITETGNQVRGKMENVYIPTSIWLNKLTDIEKQQSRVCKELFSYLKTSYSKTVIQSQYVLRAISCFSIMGLQGVNL